MPTPTARKRLTPVLCILLIATVALAGCTSNDTTSNETAPNSPGNTESFPVTVDTAYGEITVDKKPERIVALGGEYVELLGLLSEAPIAFDSGGQTTDEYYETAPWAAEDSDLDTSPNLTTAEYTPAIEAIAALEPDLILTDIWNIDDTTYERLSDIAPTYTGAETQTQTPWDEKLTALASLTGHDTAIVEEVRSELDADFAAAAERLPGLQGKTFQVAATDSDQVFWLTEYGNEPIEGLGLVPDEKQPTTGAEGVEASYSWENLHEFTADVLFIVTEHRDPSGETQVKLEADQRVAELPAAKNGTLVYFSPPTQWFAINGGTPASYRWWLDQVLPQLKESALNGR